MKRLLISLLIILGLFCLGTAAAAEGFTVGADYSILNYDRSLLPTLPDDLDLEVLTIRGESTFGSFVVGGWYSTAVGTDPEPPPSLDLDISATDFCVYGGYNLLDDEPLALAVVGGYAGWNVGTEDPTESWEAKFTSLAIGFKGSLQYDAFEASLLYLYGVSNDAKLYIDGLLGEENDDFDASCFALKLAYQFSDSLGAFLVYRSYVFEDDDLSGFGLGVQYSF